MNSGNFRTRYQAVPAFVVAVFVILAAMTSTACGGSNPSKSIPPSSLTSFDPCRDIPLSALSSWNADPTAKPDHSIGDNGSNSSDPALKSCSYSGREYGSTTGLAKEDSLYIGMTTMSLNYFKQTVDGRPYHETEINDRKVAIEGSYSAAHIPGPYTICDFYVQMKGGALYLSIEKSGDACQFLTDVAQKVIPLLPAGS